MADSGHYQSRLFNFVRARSRRFTEQYGRAIRHLQVSVKWGVQVLLSPVHLLYQPHQSAKKLEQTVQQSRSQIQLSPDDSNSQPQITADTPIQRILLLVDKPPLPDPTLKTGTSVENGLLVEPCTEEDILTLIAKSEPVNFLAFLAPWRFKLLFSPTPISPNHRPTIQGIATQLSTRTLVLVTDQNEILDSLTLQQQQKLRERIIEEVADYWHHQRLADSESLQETDSPLKHSPNNYQALAFLDRTVADLESNYLSPVSEVAITFTQRSWGLVRRIQTQLIVLLASKIQLGSKSPTSNVTDAHPLQIQALIWAAIDYFFGRRGGEHLGQTTPTTNLKLQASAKLRRTLLPQCSSVQQSDGGILSLSTSSELPSAQIHNSDPWLSESDLYGDPQEESEPSTIHQPDSTANKLKPNPGSMPIHNLLNSFQKLFPQLKQAAKLVKREKLTTSALASNSRPKSAGSVSTGGINHTQSTQLEPAPDWIETNATVMGYVKHPLEQLLAWLDRVMLWLEDVLIVVWRWVQLALRGGQK